MAYSITRKDLASITDPEMAFSTMRLLPDENDIPEEFKRGNIYTRVVECLFYGRDLPDLEISFNDGFKDETAPADLDRCVRAHLGSFGPEHQHKIAGVGYMMACVATLRTEPEAEKQQ